MHDSKPLFKSHAELEDNSIVLQMGIRFQAPFVYENVIWVIKWN
jgi:hypothetical protein